MAYLDRGAVRISYERFAGAAADDGGAGSSFPLLLSHGFGASARMWQPNLAALAAGRPVITWDMRGHGDSDDPADEAEYTQDACVADMAAVLDACGAGRAVLGGLSLGGYLSLAFWLAYPDRVAALLLFDTGPGFRSDAARQRWNERALATAARAAASPSGRPGLALAARGMLTQHDARVIEALPSVDVPVLVLVGGDDAAFLAAAEYVAAKVPGAEHVVIPGAGHASNADQPDLFNRHVLAFLDRLAVAR
jgi:pimeloyl-ACP methyl ester carboxylesterase